MSSLQRPQVRCDSQLVAEYASYTINTAKSQWEELRQTLPLEENTERGRGQQIYTDYLQIVIEYQ